MFKCFSHNYDLFCNFDIICFNFLSLKSSW